MSIRVTDKWYRGGAIRWMLCADGYVMVRKKGSIPFVLPKSEWEALPYAEDGERDERAFREAIAKAGAP